MSPSQGTLARSGTGPGRAEVTVTPEALRLLERLRGEGGGVVLILAPDLSSDVLCLGRRDVVLGPHAVQIATVRGCPVYADRRMPELATAGTIVLDVERDLDGPRFAVRVVDGTS
jgi:uncharacterized protein (DUF779 family)